MRASAIRALLGLWLLLGMAVGAGARPSPDDEIRAVIARWYDELAKEEAGRLYDIVAPGFIDTNPPYEHADTGSRALGPRIYTSLPARALEFRYAIQSIRRDASFARVEVDERGYFYAAAAQRTYESKSDTTFVLERSETDSRWRILAHQTGSYGIAPGQETDPMPDLRALFYATEGKDRDPAADAAAADDF